jgi:hypothetical protein
VKSSASDVEQSELLEDGRARGFVALVFGTFLEGLDPLLDRRRDNQQEGAQTRTMRGGVSGLDGVSERLSRAGDRLD